MQVKRIGGTDVTKWIKAVDCESTMRGFNSRHSPNEKGPDPTNQIVLIRYQRIFPDILTCR